MSAPAYDRAEITTHYRNAIEALAMVFNPCDFERIPHRYTKVAQEKFIRLAAELRILIEKEEIEPNPAHALYLKAQAARRDPGVQALIKRASRKTPIRAR